MMAIGYWMLLYYMGYCKQRKLDYEETATVNKRMDGCSIKKKPMCLNANGLIIIMLYIYID